MEIKDMNIDELEARVAEIKNELEAENVDLDALEAETRAIEERKIELKKIAEEEAEERAKALEEGEIVKEFEKDEMESRTMDVKEIRNSAEYINAYANYIKNNDDTECRALLSTNVDGGVVPVPEYVEGRIKAAWDNEEIMSLVRRTSLKGNVKVGFEVSATGAEIHVEGAAAPAEETLVLGVVEMTPQSIKKWITISDEVLDLNGEEFIDYIFDEIAYQIAKKAADTLIAMIIASPQTSSATAPAVAKVTAATPAADTIIQAIAALSDSARDAVIVMNKATYSTFKAIELNGNYAMDVFDGRRVVFNNSLPAFSAAGEGDAYAIVGDFGYGAQANFPAEDGVTFKFDDLSLAEQDLVKIVGRMYVGLGVVAPNAFTIIAK